MVPASTQWARDLADASRGFEMRTQLATVTEPGLLIDREMGRRTVSSGLEDGMIRVYVVVGDGRNPGRIKTVRINQQMGSPLLEISATRGDEGIKRIKSVAINSDYAKRGWFLLEVEYLNAGMERELEKWHEYQDAVRRKEVTKPSFPDKWLPPRVLELRKLGKVAKEKRAWKGLEEAEAEAKAEKSGASKAPKRKAGRPRKHLAISSEHLEDAPALHEAPRDDDLAIAGDDPIPEFEAAPTIPPER